MGAMRGEERKSGSVTASREGDWHFGSLGGGGGSMPWTCGRTLRGLWKGQWGLGRGVSAVRDEVQSAGGFYRV